MFRYADRLLDWYDSNHRQLPWRASPGAPLAEPYRVWLSEIMLQQTTVATVGPYFEKFIDRWPTVVALAAAELDEVLTAWAGLGYYARARNLHRCAQVVATDHQGKFPPTETELRELPGIGPYTAAAITAIAFGQRATVVDGNVERVVARLFAVEEQLPKAKSALWELADGLTPNARAGDYAQAVMDLGATVCRPRGPLCSECPVMDACTGRLTGNVESYPRRVAPKPKPKRLGTAFWLRRADGKVLLRRRPDKGLLASMIEVPSSPWVESDQIDEIILEHAPTSCEWRAIDGQVRHTFTHFHLALDLMVGQISDDQTVETTDPSAQIWADPHDLDGYALPTVMKKVVRLALAESET